VYDGVPNRSKLKLSQPLAELGWLGWLLFLCLYSILITLHFPASMMALSAGAFFGFQQGLLVILIGSYLGIVGNWFLTRWCLQDWARRRLKRIPYLKRVEQSLTGQQGLRLVILLRLSPLFPFNFVNLACALSSLSLREYLLGSMAILPGAILYVYAGALAGAWGAGVKFEQPLWLQLIGMVATFALLAWIGRVASKGLKDEVVEGSDFNV